MKTTQIISTFNRGHLLERNFDRLKELTLPDEIIVVDDGGTDNTEGVVRNFENILPVRYVYTHNPGPCICSHARNVGVREASYDWVITCEPELYYVTDCIAQLIDSSYTHPNDVISAGSVYFGPEGWKPELARKYEKAGDYTPPSHFQDAVGWVAPYTALWEKQWIVDVGGWDEGFPGYWGWDDIDLLTRLRINGHGQYIDLDIMALHQFHGLGGDTNFVNEGYFRSKSFIDQGDESKFGPEEKADLIANKGIEWGKIKTR